MPTGWQVFGASVQGTAHGKTGVPCQDAHAYRRVPGDVVVLAVADGAGSAVYSDQGAQAAVGSAADALARALESGWPDQAGEWEALFLNVYARARQCVVQLAEDQGLAPRALASTLLCAAVSEHGLAVAQLGDGVAVAGLEGGRWYVAARPQRGEYANETYFLTQGEALPPLDVRLYPDAVQAVAAMTDGLLRLVLDLQRNEPHLPFFQPLLSFAAQMSDEAEAGQQLASFLASERVSARTDDDKTLILAVRPPPV